MQMFTVGALGALLVVTGSIAAADTPAAGSAPKPLAALHPVKVTAADAVGPIFSSRAAVKRNDADDGPVTDVTLLKSPDGTYEAGLYEAGPSEQRIESYPYSEFIYVLSGSITLVAVDGSVLEAKAGESLAIPQGWKGQWKTKGYRKYYALYTEPSKTK
jgi:ethanolamine utilization protein EutQ